MIQYASFTSFRSGEHNIALLEELLDVRNIIEQTREEGECRLVDGNIRSVMARVKNLGVGDNMWIEFDDSTWMTIQRVDFTPSPNIVVIPLDLND